MKFISEVSPQAPVISVEARKYDGSVHRSWEARLVEENADLWTFAGIFNEEIRHPLLGVIRPNTLSVEYYWKSRHYNVFRFHEPEGELRNFYCNVNLPPTFENNVLRYIDLDIDVLVQPNLSYQTLDLEEFDENTDYYGYPPDVVRTARQSLADLIAMIENKEFPFDFKF